MTVYRWVVSVWNDGTTVGDVSLSERGRTLLVGRGLCNVKLWTFDPVYFSQPITGTDPRSLTPEWEQEDDPYPLRWYERVAHSESTSFPFRPSYPVRVPYNVLSVSFTFSTVYV